MNNIFLRDNKSIKSINLIYFILAIPLLLFGFYKNGIMVFIENKTNIFGLFLPLLMPILFYYTTYFLIHIFNKTNKKPVNEYSLLPVYALFIGMLLPVNTNMFLNYATFTITSLIYIRFINNKIKLNYIAVNMLLIFLINHYLFNISFYNMYLNNYENSITIKYGLIRKILGFNFGGISSSSIILVLLFALIASLTTLYKKEIPIYTTALLVFELFLLNMLNVNIGITKYAFDYSIIFLIFLASNEMINTPITRSGKLTYSIILSLFILCLSFLPLMINVTISIILCSLLSPILDILFRKS